VTAPLFLAGDVSGEVLTLAGDEGRHAATVRRVRPGERVDVGDGRGTVAECVVLGTAGATVLLDVERHRTEPPPQPRLVVVQALAKGDRGEDAVEAMTEVGVDVVVPWTASRSVVRWEGQRGEKALQRWRATAREAAKQARRAWIPEVTPLATTRDLVDLVKNAAFVAVLHESAATPLATVDVPHDGDVVVVVGPEGGITDDELAAFGSAPYRLGRSVLRTSTAGVAAAAILLSKTSRWTE
jgi:16S rRNA (uracil1498-N3)-methyltransferase